MKLTLLYAVSLMLLITFYSCSKKDDNPTSPQPVGNISAFYPGKTGSSFSYNTSINNVSAGSRIVTIGGTTIIKGNTYTIQKNFAQFGTDTSTAITYFRTTGDSLMFYVDTTGLSSFIPASVRGSLIIKAPTEAKVLRVPLSSGSNWSAYSLNVAFPPLVSLDVIQLTAAFAGSENITLNLTSGTQTIAAQKVQYQMKLSFPDSTFNLSNIQNRFYNATAWFVEGIGLARLEGNAAALQALTRSNITLADTSKTALETLTSFTIK